MQFHFLLLFFVEKKVLERKIFSSVVGGFIFRSICNIQEKLFVQ